MTNTSRRSAPHKGAPAAAMLRPSTPRLAMSPKPEPPPTEAVLGGVPPEATEAAPLVVPAGEDLERPSGRPVADPVTGEPAVDLGTIHAHKDPQLAEALRIAEKAETVEPRIGGLGRANQIHPDDHRAAQARYRERQARLRNEAPAQPVHQVEPEVEQPSHQERRERLHGAAQQEYRRRVEAMSPDEQVYLVGSRPPRPKVAGFTLSIGDIVPGASSFPRLETWLSTGILVKKER